MLSAGASSQPTRAIKNSVILRSGVTKDLLGITAVDPLLMLRMTPIIGSRSSAARSHDTGITRDDTYSGDGWMCASTPAGSIIKPFSPISVRHLRIFIYFITISEKFNIGDFGLGRISKSISKVFNCFFYYLQYNKQRIVRSILKRKLILWSDFRIQARNPFRFLIIC